METVDNYSSYQLDRLVQEIEGRLNDYEGGVSEKDETIKSFVFFVGECTKNAVNNALADYKQSIIGLIDEMIKEKRGNIESEYTMKATFLINDIATLTELKQKIEEL